MKDKFVKIRCTEEQRMQMQEDAKMCGMNFSEYVFYLLEKNRPSRWGDAGSLSCRCKACGCKNTKESKFCPNCGKRMVNGK